MEFIDDSPARDGHDRDIRWEVRGALGVITLDRPRAINALTHDMVRAIGERLDAWERDDRVATVLLQGAGERGFCAGGDVVAVHRDAVSGGSGALDFWREEYRLNARIARYPKPIVALMTGLTLGGGVGLACHARHRVVTDGSTVGMPETTIGFVPDVGGTWLLSHAPGELGTLLALTATPTDAAGAIALGLADAFVPLDRLDHLRTALEHAPADAAIAALSAPPGEAAILQDRHLIDACLAHDDVRDILAALRAADRAEVADTIAAKSPTALVLTLECLRRARRLPNLEAALELEFRVASRCLRSPDLAEGIRAQLIDKDRSPRWNPATLDGVDHAALRAFFDPLPVELDLAELHPQQEGPS